MIFIESKKKAQKTLSSLYPNAIIIDVTSKGEEPYLRLSPFYPHGHIPVPFSKNIYSFSVEGIWQGLKVFEKTDIDISKFEIQNMKGIKRTVRKFGKPVGHRKGVKGSQLLDYISAKKLIYFPSYAWVLEHKTKKLIKNLIQISLCHDVILLDYVTNEDIYSTKQSISHAVLIRKYIEKLHPELTDKRFSQPESVKKVNTQLNLEL